MHESTHSYLMNSLGNCGK